MKNFRCLHIIKTRSFWSDGRLLKWLSSLSDAGAHSDVFILEDKNALGYFSHGTTKVTTTRLWSRKLFRQRTGYPLKVPELTLRTLFFIRKTSSEVIIFHDMQHYLTLLSLCLIKPKNRIVTWDMHELPHDVLMRNKLTRVILKFIMERVDFLIYTNDERRNYLRASLAIKEPPFTILNNWPSNDYIERDRQCLNSNLTAWLGGHDFVLWLGIASIERNFPTFLETIQRYRETLKVVIIGAVDNKLRDRVEHEVANGFIYQEFVPQEEIIRFVDNAAFSVVLYKKTSMNNWLCEPNRLYQLVVRNTPVIVGNNPPMKNFLELGWPGIVLDDDGSGDDSMRKAIEVMTQESNEYRAKKRIGVPKFLNWDSQSNVAVQKLTKLIARE